jgi:hypothetical protein
MHGQKMQDSLLADQQQMDAQMRRAKGEEGE